jgi:hypothetical protein
MVGGLLVGLIMGAWIVCDDGWPGLWFAVGIVGLLHFLGWL